MNSLLNLTKIRFLLAWLVIPGAICLDLPSTVASIHGSVQAHSLTQDRGEGWRAWIHPEHSTSTTEYLISCLNSDVELDEIIKIGGSPFFLDRCPIIRFVSESATVLRQHSQGSSSKISCRFACLRC